MGATANWLLPAIIGVLCSIAASLAMSAWYNQHRNGERDQAIKDQGEKLETLVEDFKALQEALNRFGTSLAAATGISPLDGTDYRRGKGD